ncbi:putative isoleucine--tRNA ligase [Parvimonas sp. oral taxon 393 str. F0440]|nr:putative isoleucine--tRNA ligase [Parvimonas sp. oral taxon 393 str. F0440]
MAERSIEEIDENIELHRPYVDNVHLKCEKCGGTMTREKDVIDVWFDSGAMPFAQHHYPFENKENFGELFPADFISEGIDQTRGWFYSLLAISTLITGKSPYKNVLVNDLILDKDGKKMSKSRGNTIDPIELFDKYGADAVRFYSLYVSPPWVPTRFDVEGLREIESKFFRSFKNTYNFFQLYSGTDDIDPREFFVDYDKRPEIDRWILSRFNNLLKMYSENMDKFEVTKVVRAISDFVIEDLSNWYIRRNRRRFWNTEVDDDKKAVYNTTYEILLGVSKIIAPITPFVAEEMYRNLTDKKSVHLDFIPECDESLIDEALEEKMDIVRNLVTIGRASREKVKIKVRQPLSEIVVDFALKEKIGDLEELIKEELNVKKVVFEKDLSGFMNYMLKPDFKVCGKILGAKIKEFGKFLNETNAKEFIEKLEKGSVFVNLNGEETEILKEYVDVKVSAKEGFDVTMENNLFVILDTTLTDELLDEGFAREIISKIQQMRKSADFDVLDEIRIKCACLERLKKAVENYKEFIMNETLGVELTFVDSLDTEEVDFNGEVGKLFVERV